MRGSSVRRRKRFDPEKYLDKVEAELIREGLRRAKKRRVNYIV
jgi:hypothetical protein